MRTIAKAALLALVVLMLVACQSDVTPAPATPEAVAPEAVTPDATAFAPEAATPEVATPAVSPNLAGTSWVLSSLDGNLPAPDTTVTLQFGADGTASGTDGCNQYSTTFTQDGASLTINQPMASTMMACPEPIMNQAAAYSAMLAKVTGFTASERQLVLFARNDIVATFVSQASSLADTSWDVISYNNGREAVVSLILGTEISANFGATDELTGNAGCNEYFTSYAINGNAIEIGQIGSTFRLCPEPEGVMQQEQEYLMALQSAATYSFQGDLLEMRTAADQIALVMTRKVVVDLPAPPPEPATPRGRVTGAQALNVRSGPGVAFPVIGVARNADEGEIVGRSADGRWWAVSVPSAQGGIGWVSADFVLATNAENVPVIAAPPPPPPTPTPVRPPTATPAPPAAATPAPPPRSTATPVPEISFWADRTNINQGECVTLNWSVQNVQAVWVYPRGQNYAAFPRAGQGSEVVCPTTTTTYEMRVRLRDGSTVFREVTINVAAPAATATPEPPPPTATPAPAPDPLAGTRWNVVNYNNGQGIVTLLPGTDANVAFSADGQITGNAGCNSFFGPYRVDGNAISVGQLGSTSRFCPDPAGLMEQEAQILTALQSAANFRIDGATLEIQNTAGQIAVVASRAP